MSYDDLEKEADEINRSLDELEALINEGRKDCDGVLLGILLISSVIAVTLFATIVIFFT